MQTNLVSALWFVKTYRQKIYKTLLWKVAIFADSVLMCVCII